MLPRWIPLRRTKRQWLTLKRSVRECVDMHVCVCVCAWTCTYGCVCVRVWRREQERERDENFDTEESVVCNSLSINWWSNDIVLERPSLTPLSLSLSHSPINYCSLTLSFPTPSLLRDSARENWNFDFDLWYSCQRNTYSLSLFLSLSLSHTHTHSHTHSHSHCLILWPFLLPLSVFHVANFWNVNIVFILISRRWSFCPFPRYLLTQVILSLVRSHFIGVWTFSFAFKGFETF